MPYPEIPRDRPNHWLDRIAVWHLDNPLVSGIWFCTARFAGYSLAAGFIARSYARTDRNPFAVGAVAMLIDMAAVVAYFGVCGLALSPAAEADELVPILLGSILVRLAVWWLLLWLFYDRELQQAYKGWRTVAYGTMWSYGLDGLSFMGAIMAGGVWIS